MKTYPSKIGFGLIFPALTFMFITASGVVQQNWIMTSISVACLLLVVHLSLTTKYIVDDTTLSIKSSIFYSLKIDINAIRKISETNNVLSSPAASIDRLEILYNKYDSVLVSPKDKKGFIENLIALNPGIEVKYKTIKNGETAHN